MEDVEDMKNGVNVIRLSKLPGNGWGRTGGVCYT